MVDVDQDGLPDVWELANALDPQSSNDAIGDADGDSANHSHEYIAGTNPHDSNDYLRFTAVTVNDQVCQLEFSTRLSRTYAVEFAGNLTVAAPWPTLTNGISGTGGTITVNDLPTDTRYYRLQVTLNP
jgi:hypothetical protein